MRHRDAGNTTTGSYRRHSGVIDVPDAVPEEVAARRSQEQRALPDAEQRFDAHTSEVGFEVAQHDAVTGRAEVSQRRPLLPALAHVLTLVLADRAPLWPRVRRFLLYSAGHADVRSARSVVHGIPRRSLALRIPSSRGPAHEDHARALASSPHAPPSHASHRAEDRGHEALDRRRRCLGPRTDRRRRPRQTSRWRRRQRTAIAAHRARHPRDGREHHERAHARELSTQARHLPFVASSTVLTR